ncbi:hypothetical protein ASPZODRAFT_137963 [Penicilliopsis zonata CBS 506.65]|uniref:Uncharacterized protein n=1 Tax=Penicilliopsis zonata CBS 506.65 TaxID=1073090 RepID=A0A1L9SUF3_9EURO|nr:hypothetical protein ASPZODRAFT_137963 [Penicilliopsis zonata CBS 506.65]OJJ50828.1 hypothetical protein ASPZODRAFT_137963 [Penicilliopsis zonata CBS 506.65]
MSQQSSARQAWTPAPPLDPSVVERYKDALMLPKRALVHINNINVADTGDTTAGRVHLRDELDLRELAFSGMAPPPRKKIRLSSIGRWVGAGEFDPDEPGPSLEDAPSLYSSSSSSSSSSSPPARSTRLHTPTHSWWLDTPPVSSAAGAAAGQHLNLNQSHTRHESDEDAIVSQRDLQLLSQVQHARNQEVRESLSGLPQDTLADGSATRSRQARTATSSSSFIIYEDPESMDVDGDNNSHNQEISPSGSAESSWASSLSDEKENFDEEFELLSTDDESNVISDAAQPAETGIQQSVPDAAARQTPTAGTIPRSHFENNLPALEQEAMQIDTVATTRSSSSSSSSSNTSRARLFPSFNADPRRFQYRSTTTFPPPVEPPAETRLVQTASSVETARLRRRRRPRAFNVSSEF